MEKQGRVLSLIAQDPNDEEKFVVCQQTVACMRQFEGDFCFISICGEYRSGKSFLLNALFPQSCGFQTSATTISCTRGINVWSRPLKHNGLNIWLVDTEGFGSIEKDSQHDGRLFLLNLLLSNIVLYNSVGAIDQQALAKLALVCRRAASLNESAPATKLFWVLRDFALEMEDRNGRKLTADQYLQECLREGHPGQRNQKEFLRNLFEEKHCVALIRPLIDQEQLGSLKQVRWDSLREQFRSGVRSLQEGLLKAAESKVINGVHIGSHNFSLLLKEFVGAINDGDIDCGLNPTYERILQHEQAARKDAIIDAMTNKVDSVRKIMPVQLQHLVYLQQQLADIIRIQLQDLERYSNQTAIELLKLQLSQVSLCLYSAFQKENRERVHQDVRQYLYRQLIQVCPKLVSLGLQGFQARFQETFAKLKEQYSSKYATFLPTEDLQAQYSLFAEREERKIFFELTKRWRAAHRELQQKGEEIRKGRRGLEEQCKKLKQERERLQQALQQARKEEYRNIQRMKDDVEQAFREQAKIIARGYESRMQEQTVRWQQEIAILKEAVERAQSQRTKAKTEAQYERQSLNERVNAQRERSDLLAAKWEQVLSSLQLQLKETKNSLENKLRIAELKNSDLQATLNSERKKFQIISQQRKSEENRILQQLAEYRHRVDDLTDQLALLEKKYREQLERILQQEKEIICAALNAKINEYTIRCRAYEARLAEAASIADEKDFYEQHSKELQEQKVQLRKNIEKLQDIINQLQGNIKKYEGMLEQGEKAAKISRQQQLKEISLLNENLLNSKNTSKEAEQRHKHELERLKNEYQNSIREQASILTGEHVDVVERLRSQLQARWEDQRSKLKEIIRNGYDETQGLRMALFALTAHTDNIAIILNRVLSHHHNHANISNSRDSHLTDIAESPQENSDRYSPGKREELIRQTQFLAEEIEEAYSHIQSECEHLAKERANIREELKTKTEDIQSYKQTITKLRQENKGLRGELEQGKERLEELRRKTEGVSRDVGQLRDRTEGLQRENAQLRRQCELKEQLLGTRDQNHRQNSLIYKETIASLTDQNRELAARAGQLSASNEVLQSELQRFQIWATQVKSKSSLALPSDEMEMSAQKIRDLEGQIKRLARQLQESKVDKGREVHLYTAKLQENRYNELEALRSQNELLLRQLHDKQHIQAKMQQQKRISRQRQAQQDESRYSSLKEEYESYRRRSKDTIAMLESKIAVYQEQNRQLRQEYQELQGNILQKYEFDLKMRKQQVEQLKKEKSSITQFYNRKIQTMQESHNSKIQESERRVAESGLRYQQFRSELQKEHNRIMLESQRNRLKYEHLLKVNGQLIKQVEALKSKAHQMTIKEKYKSRISSLFDD